MEDYTDISPPNRFNYIKVTSNAYIYFIDLVIQIS